MTTDDNDATGAGAPLPAATLGRVLRWTLPAVMLAALNGVRASLGITPAPVADLVLFGGIALVAGLGLVLALSGRAPRVLPQLVIHGATAYLVLRMAHSLFLLEDLDELLLVLPYTADWIHVWIIATLLLLPRAVGVRMLRGLIAFLFVVAVAYGAGLGATHDTGVTTALAIRFVGVNLVISVLVTTLLNAVETAAGQLEASRAQVEQERARRHLEQARRELLEHIAHNVRTPLNGLVHALARERDDPGPARFATTDRFVRQVEHAMGELASADVGQADPGPEGASPRSVVWHESTRVLIADDVDTNLRVLSDLFRRRGVEVVTTRDGDEAHDALCAGAFSLAMLDIQMPGRSGPEVAQDIRRRQGESAPPMVAVTATLLPWRVKQAHDAGMIEVIGKPVRLADVDRIGLMLGLATSLDASPEMSPDQLGVRAVTSIDVFQLRESCCDDPGLLRMMLDSIPVRATADLGAARQALAAGDAATAVASLHRLIGFLSTAGAVHASELARNLESALAAPAADLGVVSSRIDTLETAIHEAGIELRAAIDETEGS